MNGISIIAGYFPELESKQLGDLEEFSRLLLEWNDKLNLISRKDTHEIFTRHILHSLSIAKFIEFLPGTYLVDIGTGGGFPGIPLAIVFPKVRILLTDSIGKKIRVITDLVDKLGLDNVDVKLARAEILEDKFDFALSRAVAPLKEIYQWTRDKIIKKGNHLVPNGIICLKGGNMDDEIKQLGQPTVIVSISNYFKEEFFTTKKIIHIPVG